MDEVERIVRDWNSNDISSRLDTLKRIGENQDPRLIGPLMEALADDNDKIWSAASHAFLGFGEAAIPALLEMLRDEREHVRNKGLITLLNSVGSNKIPLSHVRERLNEFIDKCRIDAPSELGMLKQRAAEMYILVANHTVATREPMEKDMLPARIKPPKGKGKMYRIEKRLRR